MSTKNTIRFEEDKGTCQVVHIYEEIFDEGPTFVAFEGFQFEAASSMELSGDWGPRLILKLPKEWALRLGLIPLNVAEAVSTASPVHGRTIHGLH